MAEPIVLFWAKKFRELCNDEALTPIQIISEFHVFCKQEEQALGDRWASKLNVTDEEYEGTDRDIINFK